MFGSPVALASIDEIATALGLPLDERQCAQLASHLALIAKWNKVYNLTSVRDSSAMLTQHLADCLAAVVSVARYAAGRSLRILDVGSGAGLPGAVLAICLPSVSVTCIDAVEKKAAFVRQVALELHLNNLASAHGRVEAFDASRFDLVISRAFATLERFVDVTRQLLAPEGVWVAMKGHHPEGEIREVIVKADVFHVEQLDVPGLNAQRCLVWMRLPR